MLNLKKSAYFFITAISVVVILSFGKSLLMPFVFAVLFWFIVRQIRTFIDRVPFIKNKFPVWIKNLLVFLFILGICNFMINVLISNINLLKNSYQKYEGNTEMIIGKINDALNINLDENIKIYFADFNFGAAFISIVNFSTNILSGVFMVILYTIFIFLEENSFIVKMNKVFTEKNRTVMYKTIENIEKSVAKYLGLKTFTSMLTGVLSYFILIIIGIDYAVFWAFIIFVLNYIPSIGSIVATLFPVIFSLLQFGEIMPAIMVMFFVGSIQMLIGNFLEPKLMGNMMNISPLVTILSLAFWGTVWGITGMFLSVPIMVITVLILAEFPQSKSIAVMLSEKGLIE